jgi:hypothetical protein
VHPDRNPNRTLLYDPSTCTLHSKPNSRPQLSLWHGLRFYHSGTERDRDRSSSSQVIKVTNSYEQEPIMHPLNAVMMTRMLVRNSGLESEGIPFGSIWWFIYIGLSAFFVIFAGIMSGLTLGLMSLGLVDLEILQRSGSPTEKKQAGYPSLFLPLNLSQSFLLVVRFLFFLFQRLYFRWFRSSTSCSSLCFCVMPELWK